MVGLKKTQPKPGCCSSVSVIRHLIWSAVRLYAFPLLVDIIHHLIRVPRLKAAGTASLSFISTLLSQLPLNEDPEYSYQAVLIRDAAAVMYAAAMDSVSLSTRDYLYANSLMKDRVLRVHVSPWDTFPVIFWLTLFKFTAKLDVSTAPRPIARPATHPFRVNGYKVRHEWVWKLGKDRDLEKPGMSGDSLESAVFMHLMFRLPGLRRHSLDDPSDTRFSYGHCLSIANNWNPKKKPLVAGRLP